VNNDTSGAVSIDLVEQGMRTLAHDWRNVLNGINLRISSAQMADEPGELETDLGEAHELIVSATKELGRLSRRIAKPTVSAIPYPIAHFVEDTSHFLRQNVGTNADRIKWEDTAGEGKVLVDFAAVSAAMGELIDNTFRYVPAAESVTINVARDGEFLRVSWSENHLGDPPTPDWGKVPFFTTQRGRLGLGLYFANRVMEAHNGSLLFEFSTTTRVLQTSFRLPLENS
jgi:K+-sensing histidine kinase KdpD